MKITNKTYDLMKLIALLFVPISTFIGAILSIWNIPHAEQITATLAAADTCLGAILVILSKIHNAPYPLNIEDFEPLEDGTEEDEAVEV